LRPITSQRTSSEKSELKYLGVCRGDPNNVDVPAATKKGVVVIRTPGRNANAVAELTIGMIFTVLRWIVEADDDIRAGRWVIDGRIRSSVILDAS